MIEKDTITQREILLDMHQAVNYLPKHVPQEIRSGMQRVLRAIPGEWNAATSEEPFPLSLEPRLRHHLYVVARRLVDSTAASEHMSPRTASLVRSNLQALDSQSRK